MQSFDSERDRERERHILRNVKSFRSVSNFSCRYLSWNCFNKGSQVLFGQHRQVKARGESIEERHESELFTPYQSQTQQRINFKPKSFQFKFTYEMIWR